MGGHVFRKYIREQFLVVGLQVFHFLFLLGCLQLPQEIQSVLVHSSRQYSSPISAMKNISTNYITFPEIFYEVY